MANIRYRTAFDENNNLVDIRDVSKEERHEHTYRCIMCGEVLLPRLGNERARHFYHGKDTTCDGESYIHKLAKLRIKEKFDKSEHFFVSYDVTHVCSQQECRLRNKNCVQSNEQHKIDLRHYYDTATIEAPVNGFIADVLLSNSKKPELPPVLLEIRVTHACEQEKIDSGLKIIEIHVKKEAEINELLDSEVFQETTWKKDKDIAFYSFNREIKMKLLSEVYRYIMNSNKPSGYIRKITCDSADKRLRSSSILELNAVNIKHYGPFEIWNALQWVWDNKRIPRCNICKFYYATQYEDRAKCRLSVKCGTPMYPLMQEAEKCRCFRFQDNAFGWDKDAFYVEEVKNDKLQKPEFKVIIVHEFAFKDYNLFRSKCDYFLGSKFESTNVVLISGRREWTITLCNKYAIERKIQIENHPGEWDALSQEEAFEKRNEEELSIADAAIVFWSGKSNLIEQFIAKANERNVRVGIVRIDRT